MKKLERIIISGGGSGGHIFPAVAIANEIKERFPGVEILFVGAKGKMEMKKVPEAGYKIKGLWISGLQRSLTWKNLLFPIKLLHSLWTARKTVRNFKPQVVVGVGGYASGPTLAIASVMGIPTVIQEQNSYAGLTNKWLANKVDKVCVAYEGLDRYFPVEKIVDTGNPVRKELKSKNDKFIGYRHFKLESTSKTILILGGSLGARTLNEAMRDGHSKIAQTRNVQFIWQMGKLYESTFGTCETAKLSSVKAHTFIDRMDLAYCCADLVICRAGALTISELCLLGKASILVPSPNVAEDHQTKNAKALLKQDAALMVEDRNANQVLLKTALEIIHEEEKLSRLRNSILKMARPDATENIVKVIEELAAD